MHWNIQAFVGLLAIGVINICVFQYMTTNTRTMDKDFEHCTLGTFLEALKLFMDKNGRRKFSEGVSNKCIEQMNENTNDLIRNSLSKVIHHCYTENMGRKAKHDVTLTLFTSWTSTPSKFHVHNNTVINWGTFMPRVNLVLFTNDSFLSNFVEERGWKTFPIIQHIPEVPPILKYMFLIVMENYNSTFYGYTNSDILFDSSLMDTLTAIYDEFEDSFDQNAVFISGQRTNIDFVSLKEAASYGNIKHAAKTRGVPFAIESGDYFITNKLFSWSGIPELVIGRRAYDNWLVLHARTVNATTIDSTRTLLAVHQTTKEGNLEGHNHTNPDINDNLLLELSLNRHYEAGFTTCMKYETFLSLCDETVVWKRQTIPNDCLPL